MTTLPLIVTLPMLLLCSAVGLWLRLLPQDDYPSDRSDS